MMGFDSHISVRRFATDIIRIYRLPDVNVTPQSRSSSSKILSHPSKVQNLSLFIQHNDDQFADCESLPRSRMHWMQVPYLIASSLTQRPRTPTSKLVKS